MKLAKLLESVSEKTLNNIKDAKRVVMMYVNLPKNIVVLKQMIEHQQNVINELIFLNDILLSTQQEKEIDVNFPSLNNKTCEKPN